MKRSTREWIEKAEGDWAVAQRERQASKPVWDAVCFHAQQCAEKYLKACLEEGNIPFEKIHDLVALVDSSGGMLSDLAISKKDLAYLSVVGIAARYPGAQADRGAAEKSVSVAAEVRKAIRDKLGQP